MRRSLLLIALLASCKPPYSLILVRDPTGAARAAASLSVQLDDEPPLVLSLSGQSFDPEVSFVLSRKESAGRHELAIEAIDASGGLLATANTSLELDPKGGETILDLLPACTVTTKWGSQCSQPSGAGAGVCVRGVCGASFCGDGVLTDGEDCDEAENNQERPDRGQCRTDCTRAVCNDGIVDRDEECDDGDLDNDDACLDDCRAARCGDGHTWSGVEDCDLAMSVDLDCAYGERACQRCDPDACGLVPGITSFCGDGLLDEAHEECDDSNQLNLDGCSRSCSFVMWARKLEGDLAPGVILGHDGRVEGWGEDNDLSDLGDVPEPPRVLVIPTSSGTVHALDPLTGEDRWTFHQPDPIRQPAVWLNGYFVVVTERGRIIAIDRDGPSDAPSSVLTASLAPDGAALRPSGGIVAGPVFGNAVLGVLGEDGRLYVFSLDTTSLSIDRTTEYALAAPPCPGCRFSIGTWLFFRVVVPVSHGVLVGCQQNPVHLISLPPGESPVGEVTILGDGDQSEDPDDFAFAVTNLGNVFRIPLTQLAMGSPSCPRPAEGIELFFGPALDPALPRVTSPPLLVPLSAVTYVFPTEDGRIWSGSLGTLNPPEVLYDAGDGVPFREMGTLDAEGQLYFSNERGTIHTFHVVSGRRSWSYSLDRYGRQSGSPLVANGAVYASTLSGWVIALERGGTTVPFVGAWSRERASNLNTTGTNCSTAGGEISIWILLGLVAAALRASLRTDDTRRTTPQSARASGAGDTQRRPNACDRSQERAPDDSARSRRARATGAGPSGSDGRTRRPAGERARRAVRGRSCNRATSCAHRFGPRGRRRRSCRARLARRGRRGRSRSGRVPSARSAARADDSCRSSSLAAGSARPSSGSPRSRSVLR